MSNSSSARQTIYDEGIVIRREVLGNAYVDQALARNLGTQGESLQHYVTQMVWGGIWTRPGLDRRSRSLVNIGILVALNQHHEFAAHVRGALRNGLAREEIAEAILQATAYCGAPAGLAAMRVAQTVFDQIDADTTDSAQ